MEKSEQWLWNEKRQSQAHKVIELLETIAEALVLQTREKQYYNDEPDGEVIPVS